MQVNKNNNTHHKFGKDVIYEYDHVSTYCSFFPALRCNGVDEGCCTEDNPCVEGDGDCDDNSECAGDLECSKTPNCPWGDGDTCCMTKGISRNF